MRVERRGSSLRIVPARGVPLELHWSVPLGLLFFGRGTIGGALGAFTIILAHELGHAAMVRARGLRNIEIVIHGLGGSCRYEGGWATPLDLALIAWGGVLAQALLLVMAIVVGTAAPGVGLLGDFLKVLILTNVGIAVLNLLPFPPFDGATAWKLPGLLLRLGRRRRLEQQHDALRRELEASRREDGQQYLH
jgi:stage IV sporulation protein FB